MLSNTPPCATVFHSSGKAPLLICINLHRNNRKISTDLSKFYGNAVKKIESNLHMGGKSD